MAITHIANFTVRLGGTSVPREGFGVPLICAYHTTFPELVRQYTGDPSQILSAMGTDGFTTNDTVYKMASKLLTQQGAPRVIKIGRLSNADNQICTLRPLNVTAGSIYILTFGCNQGSETFTYTVSTSETVTTVATAIEALIDAAATVTDIVAVDNGNGSISVSSTDADGFHFDWTVNGRSLPSDLDILDSSTNANIAADLSLIEAYDPDWYALLLAVESPAISEAVGDWVATRTHCYLAATSDSDATESGTSTDIASVMLGDANNRVGCLFETQYRGRTQCALAGDWLGRAPGSATMANKSLSGVTAADLTSSLFTNLDAKKYTVLRKLNSTLSATTGGYVSNHGATGYRYLDVLRGLDWLEARSEESLASLVLSNPKIPFTAEGLALVRTALERVVADGVAQGVLSPGDPSDEENDPTPKVVLPRIGEAGADATARAARALSNVKITGRLAGAIHTFEGTMVVSF